MVAALYRRYRPETFTEMIGQRQVTDPLMTALRTGRVNHAYLFSGPRGCGKTSSARILARCLNCAEGPTPEPCGRCDSCVELGRAGGGSIDVLEIDAASHGGVDDARDLRERAVMAPTRDRYKIFIIDEAHMVTSQGFNALLKVVEEPPEHVMFIFATTEPEKVIGTIRSRTHHFPFRLIPPAPMLEYIEQICAQEGVSSEAGVLPLVVRAGGGSARDTMSLLDQLIAGTEGDELQYDMATQLLGFTSQGLLNDSVSAFAAGDAAWAYQSVDAVIQSGQDPRRFVEDLLERVRDLIVVKALGESASSVLRGVAASELEHLHTAAARFSPRSLSAIADAVNETLTEMSGVTSPRVQLELMIARILVAMRATFGGAELQDADSPELAVGGGSTAGSPRQAQGKTSSREPARVAPAAPAGSASASASSAAPASASTAPASGGAPADRSRQASRVAASDQQPSTSQDSVADAAAAWAAVAPVAGDTANGETGVDSAISSAVDSQAGPSGQAAANADVRPRSDSDSDSQRAVAGERGGIAEAKSEREASADVEAAGQETKPTAGSQSASSGRSTDPDSIDIARVRAAWPEVLEQVTKIGQRASWTVISALQPIEYAAGKLRVEVPNQGTMEQLRQGREQGNAPGQHLKAALQAVFGFDVTVYPRVRREDGGVPAEGETPAADPERHRGGPSAPAPAAAQNESRRSAPRQATTTQTPTSLAQAAAPAKVTWDVVAIPGSTDGPGSGWDEVATETAPPPSPAEASPEPEAAIPPGDNATQTGRAGSGPTGPGSTSSAGIAQPSHSAAPTRTSAVAESAPAIPERIPEEIAIAETALRVDAAPAPVRRHHPATVGGTLRYGESVIRERLGARFVGEEEIAIPVDETMNAADAPPDDFEAPPEEH